MNYTHGSLENEILSAVWTMEESTETANTISVSEVLEDINKSGNVRAYTTVKTVMDRLVEKDMLARYKRGKKFYYKSTSSRDDMAKSAIKRLAGQYFNNDIRSLMKALEKECSSLAK
ncbi:MAG: BlaI/MecI/CopY family transcriptional regulator [Candidatus Gastranaerophilales bacterium]|nr:BlaI/MecI/CopY family transcriptional regulator [Candidatus Gastranaerophilales bacterium]